MASLPIPRSRRRTVVLAALALLWVPVGPAPAAAGEREEAWVAGKVLERRSRAHGRAYSFFAPARAGARQALPLVVSIHGRGGSGQAEMRAWQGLASQHRFLVACPDMVTATNHLQPASTLAPAEEDDQVLLSIVEEVAEHFKVQRRAVLITGFSGGGNPSYHTGLRHPEWFTHICTRGGNFSPPQVPPAAARGAGPEHTRILIFFGERDHELIIGPNGNDGQAHQARDALVAAGYRHVEFEQVPGMGHESRPRHAAEWFAAWIDANEKRLKAAEKADDLVARARAATAKGRAAEAYRHLATLEAVEEKAGLPPRAPAERERVDAAAGPLLEAAAAAEAAGDLVAARRGLEQVAREFKGRPPGATAAARLAALGAS